MDIQQLFRIKFKLGLNEFWFGFGKSAHKKITIDRLYPNRLHGKLLILELVSMPRKEFASSWSFRHLIPNNKKQKPSPPQPKIKKRGFGRNDRSCYDKLYNGFAALFLMNYCSIHLIQSIGKLSKLQTYSKKSCNGVR